MYKYTDKNLFDNSESYFYSKFGGLEFLQGFLSSRKVKLLELKHQLPNDYNSDELKKEIISIIKSKYKYNSNDSVFSTYEFFFLKLEEKEVEDNDLFFKKIIQKFEISKRINELYTAEELKPIGNNKSLEIYFLFGICLIQYFQQTNKMIYLNAILKLSDILCSLTIDKSLLFSYGSVYIIENELDFINALLKQNKIKL